ncbi:MAG: MFS transporter [Acinetobacter sp.]|nr:MFS transporter [Acinetobacter sp.]
MHKKTQAHFAYSRRFAPMFLTQFFGAFNDNVFKQLLLLLMSYGWLQNISNVSLFTNLAALLFILPYFIFSATAGQIADRYERAALIRKLKLLEIIIMLLATVGLFLGNVWLLLLSLFLMGTQSTFFGPIKYAILPDILHEQELISGNAIFQAGTSLAILFGMLLGGVLIFYAQGQMWVMSAAILALAILGYMASVAILPQRIAAPQLKINWNFLQTSWQTLAYIRQLPLIFLILLGNSWYWFYGATLLTQIPEMTKIHLLGNETIVSLLLTCFSIGVGIGSFLCQRIGKNLAPRQLLKLIFTGAIGLTLFALYLAYALYVAPVRTQLLTISEFLSQPIYLHSLLATTLLGIVGGFYIVPLYTMMQYFSPATHRARIVAGNNILNAIFMVSSAIISILILSVMKLSIIQLLIILAVFNSGFTWLLLRQLRKNKQLKHQNPA